MMMTTMLLVDENSEKKRVKRGVRRKQKRGVKRGAEKRELREGDYDD